MPKLTKYSSIYIQKAKNEIYMPKITALDRQA